MAAMSSGAPMVIGRPGTQHLGLKSYPMCLSNTRQTASTRAQLTERELTIKLSIAQSTDRLDLSYCELKKLPEGLFNLTNVVELSLAGNQLTELPAEVSKLENLQRLVVAGNWLTHLPQELWDLKSLEGLWVHGNLLEDLPEQIGHLTSLRMISLAGNRLTHIPNTLTQLVKLKDLNLSGNQIMQLPEGIGALTALTMIALHGNQLKHLPKHGWQHLVNLKEVTLQGNNLTHVPDSFAQIKSLTELSLADNQLRSLPVDLSGWSSLQRLHLYSNKLTEIPLGPMGLPALLSTGMAAAPSASALVSSSTAQPKFSNRNGRWSSSSMGQGTSSRDPSGSGSSSSNGSTGGRLASLWLEGNPLSDSSTAGLIDKIGSANTTRIGLDERQLSGAAAAAAHVRVKQAGNTSVRRGIVKGEGPGYFKLQPGPGASSSNLNSSTMQDRALVVAFGSAPGLPNWGGVMGRVYAAAETPDQSAFDVLYVVDSHRSWYCGGDPALMEQRYTARLKQYTEQYEHVVMVGDSMGATAALLFSPLATAALSFCPQVDLTQSSIRPGQPAGWQETLQSTLQAAVAASKAKITVYTGTWQHDVDQANLLAQLNNVHIKVHSVDSHRLALALARQGKLVPIVREAVLGALGLASGNMRLANLL